MIKKLIDIIKISNSQTVKYYLLEQDILNNTKTYGVEIEFFDKANLKTREKINKITDSYELALDIIKILADKKVTPNSLFYVIDEIFDLAQK